MSPASIQEGYFQVIADPVSTCVQDIFELSPLHKPLFVTKFKIPPFPLSSPGNQFWIVEYFICASFNVTNSYTVAFLNYLGSKLITLSYENTDDNIKANKQSKVETLPTTLAK